MKNSLLALIACFCLGGCQTPEKNIKTEPISMFIAGDHEYACFRIPAIVKTTKGTLLAFAEARKKGCADTGDIDIVLRRSKDGGRSWGNLQVVWDAGDDVAGNPAPVVDRKNGNIWMLCTWNLGTDHESQIIAQQSEDTRRVFVISSQDDGISWSGAKEITSETKQPDWTWYATGPVHGIQLSLSQNKNRLIIPCDHIEAVSNRYFSHVIYSDDHGKNWRLGGSTVQDQVNECTIAELSDGRLIMNMRNYDRTQKNRKISFSNDGGLSWSDIQDDTSLIEPICQAALLSVGRKGGGQNLFFLNPADSLSRKNLTLKISQDDGQTWIVKELIHAGPSAYSDLVSINKNILGCLYEAGAQSPYEGIWFKKVKINQKP